MGCEGESFANFHDATLSRMCFDWENGILSIDAHVFLNGLKENAKSVSLVWTGVRQMTVSHKFPWGKSQSINTFRCDNGFKYYIEMQSGDMIEIEAESFQIHHK